MAIPSEGLKTKTCSACKQKKPVNEFYKHSKAKDGLHPECKPCVIERNGNYRRRMAVPIPSITMRKRCTVCRGMKPVTEYYDSGTGRGVYGVMAKCKECMRELSRERLDRPGARERYNNEAREQRKGFRDKCLNAYGAKCVCCGESDKQFLTLDHVNNDGAKWRRETFGKRISAGYPTYLWLMRNDFPEGFQILCANCQFGKRMNNGICPHQATCNDQPKGVGPSGPKRNAPHKG